MSEDVMEKPMPVNLTGNTKMFLMTTLYSCISRWADEQDSNIYSEMWIEERKELVAKANKAIAELKV